MFLHARALPTSGFDRAARRPRGRIFSPPPLLRKILLEPRLPTMPALLPCAGS